MFDSIGQSLATMGDPLYWLAVVVAVALSVGVGLIPGISGTVVMALMVPFVVFTIDDPAIGLVMLATVTGVNNTLDSIPAVLVGLPGGATQVTYLEGHQLARRGMAAHTLGAVYGVSMLGGIFGAIVLALSIPVMKPFILRFSFAEVAAMALFGIAMVALLSKGAMVRGLAAGLIGMLLGTIGVDPLTGWERYTFGEFHLYQGLPIVATIIGVFVLPEMIDLSMTREPVAAQGAITSNREVFRGFVYGVKRWRMLIRQSIFGVFVGAIPGVGSGVIDWLAYAFGIAFTKDKSQFGKGSLEGVLFAESAQNSKEGGQAIPTLALGIPGGPAWAIVIVAMLFYNVAPGPDMLGRNAHITITLVATLAIANVMVTGLGLVATGQLARLTRVPYPVIGSVVIPVAVVAAFLNTRLWQAVGLTFAFCIVGLLMKRLQWPRPPLVLGFILGPIFEGNLRFALGFEGNLWGVVTRPVMLILLVLLVVFVAGLNLATARSEREVARQNADSLDPRLGIPAERSAQGVGTVTTPATWMRRMVGLERAEWRIENVLRWENLFPVGVLIILGVAFWMALDFGPKAGMVPRWLCGGAIVMVAFQLVRQSLTPRGTAEIMDLGMRSTGMAGAGRSGAIIFGLIVLSGLVSISVGLQYAAIFYAVAGSILLIKERYRWLVAVATGLIVSAFVLGLAGRVMAILWPKPLLLEWLSG